MTFWLPDGQRLFVTLLFVWTCDLHEKVVHWLVLCAVQKGARKRNNVQINTILRKCAKTQHLFSLFNNRRPSGCRPEGNGFSTVWPLFYRVSANQWTSGCHPESKLELEMGLFCFYPSSKNRDYHFTPHIGSGAFREAIQQH